MKFWPVLLILLVGVFAVDVKKPKAKSEADLSSLEESVEQQQNPIAQEKDEMKSSYLDLDDYSPLQASPLQPSGYQRPVGSPAKPILYSQQIMVQRPHHSASAGKTRNILLQKVIEQVAESLEAARSSCRNVELLSQVKQLLKVIVSLDAPSHGEYGKKEGENYPENQEIENRKSKINIS